MNKKTILGVVCTLACATNFVMSQPASAEAILNAQQQEAHARELEQMYYGGRPQTYSQEAISVTPVVQKLQKRLCDKNGIEVTTALFRNTYDFQNKIHPIQVVDNYNNAFDAGAGYTYIGIGYMRSKGMNFANQYDYIVCEKTIAHETGHAIGGHATSAKFDKDAEKLAENTSVRLLDNLPEGGWGAYLVAIYRNTNRPEINAEIKNSFVKATNGKISMPTFTAAVYHPKKGWHYNLNIDNYMSPNNAYFGGQVANCIAKGALKVENLEIVDNNLREIKFGGDYLLVCRSSNLPNGYRVLAGVYGTKEKVMNDWNQAKSLLASGNDIYSYNEVAQMTLFKGNSNQWKMWLALATAYDVQHH